MFCGVFIEDKKLTLICIYGDCNAILGFITLRVTSGTSISNLRSYPPSLIFRRGDFFPLLSKKRKKNTSDRRLEHFLIKRSGSNKPSSLIIRCVVSCIQTLYICDISVYISENKSWLLFCFRDTFARRVLSRISSKDKWFVSESNHENNRVV